MSEQVGSLVVSLAADIARFDTQMRQAQGIAAQAMGKIEAAAAAATKALSFLGVGLSAGALVGFVNDTVKAAGALEDLAESTGATVEEFSRFERVIKLTGAGSLDQLGGGMQRLAKSMVEAEDDASEAGRAFKALGISAKDAGGQIKSSGAVLEEVARELAKYEDNASKVAVVQALLGKSGADLIPLLKEIAANQEIVGRHTTETAAAAETLDKEVRKLSDAFDGMKTSIGNDLIPLLTEFLKQLQDGREIAGGFFNALRLFGVSLAPFSDANKAIEELTGNLEKARAQLRRLENSGFDGGLQGIGLRRTIADMEKQLEYIRRQADRQFAAGYRDFKDTDTGIPRSLQFRPQQAPTAGIRGRPDPQLEALLRRSAELARIQEEAMKELNQASNEQLRIEKEREQTLERIHAQAKGEKAEIKEQIDDREKMLDSLYEQTELLRVETTLVGANAEHRERVLAVMQATPAIQAAAAAGEWEIYRALVARLDAQLELIGAQGREAKAAEERAKQEREAQRLIEEQQRAAEQLQDTLTDALMRAFESGKDFAQSFKDTLINVFKTMVLRPSIEFLVKGALGGLGFGVPGMANASGGGGFDFLGGLGSLFGGGGVGTMAGSFAGNIAGMLGFDALGTAAAVSGVFSTIGAAVPYIGLAMMAASALGLFDRGGPKVGAFAQTSGLNLDPFFGGGDSRPLEQLVTGTQASYRSLVSGFGGRPGDFQFALGYDTDPEGDAPNRISAGASVDGVTVVERLSEDIGRDQARLEEEIAGTVGDALLGALLASDIPEAVKDLLRGFEGTTEELEAYALKLVGVNALLNTTNVGIQQILGDLSLADVEKFSDYLGGVQNAAALMNSYIENFYNSTERMQIATESLTGDFGKLGVEMPKNRAAFRAMVESIDTSTEAGIKLKASMLALAPAFDGFIDSVEAAAERLRSNMMSLGSLQSQIHGTSQIPILEGIVSELVFKFAAGRDWAMETIASSGGFYGLANLLTTIAPADFANYSQEDQALILRIIEGRKQLADLSSASDTATPSIYRVIDAVDELGKTAADAAEEMRAQLRDWLSELLTGSLSPLAPEQQLGIAKDQYLAALQSGEDIQGAAGRYLEIARQFNPLAYNGAFVDVVNQVGARATPSGMPAPDGFGGVTEMLARVRATTEAGADEVATAVRESATLIINTLTGPRTVVFR